MQTVQNSTILNDVNFWINLVIVIISFITTFIIKSIKKTNEDQWKSINRIEKQLNTLQGEHNMKCGK